MLLCPLAGNFDRAISCLEHQITLAKEQKDKTGEGDACCGLGGVYQQMGEYDRAIDFHKKDLKIAQVSSKNSSGRYIDSKLYMHWYLSFCY